MNKTIAQVVKEYRNRQNPQFERIGVLHSTGIFERYSNPSNIKEHFENDGWLEFDTVCDCIAHCPDTTITTSHVRLHLGTIVEYIEKISDVKNNIKNPLLIKKCANVIMRTHSGKRETFANIENLTENKYERSVEFDNDVAASKTHVKMNGEIEMYEESIE